MEDFSPQIVKEINDFFEKEIDYVSLVEECSEAQTQLLVFIDEVEGPDIPLTDKLTAFFFHTTRLFQLLKPLDKNLI